MKSVLTADSLCKRFGSIIAVDNISFEIFRGEIFGFLGPNGAGKTTSIRMMSGLLKPDSGKVTIDCEDKRKSTGLCPQHIVIWENLTCLEQMLFMGKMYKMSSTEAGKKALELLESLGLYDSKDRLAGKLSGGMQRRLNIGLALIHSPQILFLDEPQAGLDPQSRILVRHYIRSIKEKTTIVLTTHDMEEAEKLSDRICIMDKGKLLISGTPSEIMKLGGYEDVIEIDINNDFHETLISSLNPELSGKMVKSSNRMSFNVKDPIAAMTSILDAVKVNQIQIENLRLRKNSLEDVFINLTGRSLRE
jgi:ABC-2 type transport system ATP-binding protein